MLVATETIKHIFQVLQKVKKGGITSFSENTTYWKENIYFIIVEIKRIYVLYDHRANKM